MNQDDGALECCPNVEGGLLALCLIRPDPRPRQASQTSGQIEYEHFGPRRSGDLERRLVAHRGAVAGAERRALETHSAPRHLKPRVTPGPQCMAHRLVRLEARHLRR